MGAHCTGIEAVYRIRERLGLGIAKVRGGCGQCGINIVLGEGIHPGELAK
jgi:hypothetical protein